MVGEADGTEKRSLERNLPERQMEGCLRVSNLVSPNGHSAFIFPEKGKLTIEASFQEETERKRLTRSIL